MRLKYNKSMFGLAKRLNLIALAVLLTALTGVALQPKKAQALSGSEFNPGNIISDGVFFNGDDMSYPAIQNFLNSKVPVCDTSGSLPRGGTTRAAYGTSVGYPPPYICLKDFVQENLPTKPAETGLCTGLGPGTKPAALIIYEVSISCGINPKVLLVLLQKEQSLITDDWPWSIQYRSATGYGCPDTAPCDAEYYGFFNQVYNAARQYKRYARDAPLFNFRAGMNNYIQWSPNAACGGSNVFIANQATAGLYNYTPYQPNAAALNNLYGTGDGCSAYGNRNFWRMYTDWFGNTQVGATCIGNEQQESYVRRFYNPKTAQHFYSAKTCDIEFLRRLGFTLEGPIFNTTDPAWGQPIYRYYNPQTRLHHWSTVYETPEQLAAGGSGYRQEAGIVFYVLPASMPNPPHRIDQFYNPHTYLHVWGPDTSQADRDFLYYRGNYLYENVAWYTQ